MAIFRYRAKEGTNTVEGQVDALTRNEAVEKIHHMGFVPIAVEETESAALPSAQTPVFSMSSGGKVKSKDITLFTRQLVSLMRAGVPILHSLQTLARQTGNATLKNILEEVRNAVKDGKTFSSALEVYPKVFPPLFVAMVRSGESAGNLQDILARVAEHRQKQEEISARVKTALAYPILMAGVGALTIVFMFAFVMPRLMQTFTSLDQQLPLPTRMLLGINSGFQHGWPYMLGGLAAAILVFKKVIDKETKRKFISRIQLRMPVVGDIVLKSELARFSRTLEMLLRSGVPILTALETSIPVLGNDRIKEELYKSYAALKEGGSLGKSLERSEVFPVFMTSLIIVGEESGKLSEGLAEIAESYTRDTEETVKLLTSLLEPAIILVMGLVVGFIVIAMLLPIFEVNFMAG